MTAEQIETYCNRIRETSLSMIDCVRDIGSLLQEMKDQLAKEAEKRDLKLDTNGKTTTKAVLSHNHTRQSKQEPPQEAQKQQQ